MAAGIQPGLCVPVLDVPSPIAIALGRHAISLTAGRMKRNAVCRTKLAGADTRDPFLHPVNLGGQNITAVPETTLTPLPDPRRQASAATWLTKGAYASNVCIAH